MRRIVLPALTVAAVFAAGPALAGTYDKVFFVKRGATAAAMYDDREACTKVAESVGLGRGGEAYSDPDYGMISAMGAALETGSLETGSGIGKAVRRAALEKCMEKRGWTHKTVPEAEEKAIRRASRKDPAALDAWLKANEPAMVQTVATPPAPAATPAMAAVTPAVPAAAAPAAAASAAPAAPTDAPAVPAPATAGTAPVAAPSPAPTAADSSATPPK
jgi:hypothetical protein